MNNYLLLFIGFIVCVLVILHLNSNYRFCLLNKIKFKIIPKGTKLYHHSYTNILQYKEKYTWFSDDKYYIYKIKKCHLYNRKCPKNQFLSLQHNQIHSFKKQPCLPINTYELILQQDMILLNLPDEVFLNAIDITNVIKHLDILGFVVDINALNQKRPIYLIKYNHQLFTFKKIYIDETKLVGDYYCSYLNWYLYFIKNHLFYLVYFSSIRYKLFYLEKYYWNSYINNNRIIPKKKHKIRIATYNIHYWYDALNNRNINNIITNILKYDLDIICLQEFIYHKTIIPNMIKKYKYYYYSGNLAIFTRYQILDIQMISLGRDSKYYITRYLMIVKIKYNNLIIHLLHTHLDVYDTSERVRYLQISKILLEVDKLKANYPNDLLLLLGDLNSISKPDYSSHYFNTILMRNPKYLPPKNIVINEIKKYLYDTKDLDHTTKYLKNLYTVWSLRRVDYIFINKQIPINYYINYNTSSDHYMVLVDINPRIS